MKPLLSIAIPVYNGEKTIGETLNHIVLQVEDSVEIVISDNASTDNTAEIINKYKEKYPAIRYFRNEKNLDFDKNVDLCVRRSEGDFVWIFADDDIMVKGAVEIVLGIIKQHPEVCEIYIDSLKPYTKLNNDCLCKSGDDFFAITKFRCGGLSSNVVNKNIWERIDLSEYLGSGWIHMAYLVLALSKYPAYIYKDSLKYEIDAPKRRDANASFRVMLNFVKIFQKMHLYGYDKKTMKRGVLTIKGSYLTDIPLFYKPRGLKVDVSLIKECISLYKTFPSFWLIDLPLLLVPRIFFMFLYRIYNIPFIKRIYRKCNGVVKN